MGSFKTPTLRGLLDTGPYMHDGSEATLEDVIEFYNQGGIANPFLDPLMRNLEVKRGSNDFKASRGAFQQTGGKLPGNGETATVARRLRLSGEEKENLILFLRALQGDPVDPIIADPNRLP
jgi:cytochrome c peroxidase